MRPGLPATGQRGGAHCVGNRRAVRRRRGWLPRLDRRRRRARSSCLLQRDRGFAPRFGPSHRQRAKRALCWWVGKSVSSLHQPVMNRGPRKMAVPGGRSSGFQGTMARSCRYSDMIASTVGQTPQLYCVSRSQERKPQLR